MKQLGIEALSFYVPKLYVSIEELAMERDIPYEKLKKGLGLEKMAIPDVNEDAASFAANALWSLFEQENLDPNSIGRIYVGTESAVDGSKPTATYAIEHVEKLLAPQFGERCFKNCDVVDMTFACIGGVDAMHNSLDWIRSGENRKAIVIASDLSKYELNSTGEYTQGAGAVAVLLSENPSLMVINNVWGIGTQSVGDFFKPRRNFTREEVAKDLLSFLNIKDTDGVIENITSEKTSFWNTSNNKVALFKEEPVFDGHYSNQCYSDRITEALAHFRNQKEIDFASEWDYFVFHLPYAYHGRRIIMTNWLEWIKNSEVYNTLIEEIGAPDEDYKTWLKKVSKSKLYQKFISDRIEITERASSQIGNMYTASIFMALVSLFSYSLSENNELENAKVGFIAYGSGSKSKVFEGRITKDWKDKIEKIPLLKTLEQREKINIKTYENLHAELLEEPIEISEKIVLSSIENEKETALGLRTYSLQK